MSIDDQLEKKLAELKAARIEATFRELARQVAEAKADLELLRERLRLREEIRTFAARREAAKVDPWAGIDDGHVRLVDHRDLAAARTAWPPQPDGPPLTRLEPGVSRGPGIKRGPGRWNRRLLPAEYRTDREYIPDLRDALLAEENPKHRERLKAALRDAIARRLEGEKLYRSLAGRGPAPTNPWEGDPPRHALDNYDCPRCGLAHGQARPVTRSLEGMRCRYCGEPLLEELETERWTKGQVIAERRLVDAFGDKRAGRPSRNGKKKKI